MPVYKAPRLRKFAGQVLTRAGLEEPLALSMANVFVEADLLGYHTHGLFRLPQNVNWILEGSTRISGEPRVLTDRCGIINWDADYLPGPSVMMQAVDLLCNRVEQHGMASMTLRKCQHISCLAPYVLKAAEQGLVAWMVAATPAEKRVCPHGGKRPLFSTNPFAFAAPTQGDPILADFSFAETSAGRVRMTGLEGREMDFPCLIDKDGNLSTSPSDLSEGGLLPLGGINTGHKGFGLLLWSELLASSLGGWGRADDTGENEANSVFIQIMDPEAFSPGETFRNQADVVSKLCRHILPIDPGKPVRVPGDQALEKRKQQLKEGIDLPDAVVNVLTPLVDLYGVALD